MSIRKVSDDGTQTSTQSIGKEGEIQDRLLILKIDRKVQKYTHKDSPLVLGAK